MHMLTTLLLQADPNGIRSQQSLTAGAEPFWTPAAVVFCGIGVCILLIWRIHSGGFACLQTAPVRRNRLTGFELIIIVFIWLFMMFGIGSIIEMLFSSSSWMHQQSLYYPVNAVLYIFLVILMGVMAHLTFARRLKGFGLNFRTIGRDVGFSIIHLLAVYPLILLALWAVLVFGQLIKEGFNIQQHQTLTFLLENLSKPLAIVVVVFTVFIVPVFEEMLFRGFLQNTLRSIGINPWAVIVCTSVFFALMHYPNWSHIPALFVLSCGLGYAYERSGSLLRPIFMHIFFNGISVAATFLMAS